MADTLCVLVAIDPLAAKEGALLARYTLDDGVLVGMPSCTRASDTREAPLSHLYSSSDSVVSRQVSARIQGKARATDGKLAACASSQSVFDRVVAPTVSKRRPRRDGDGQTLGGHDTDTQVDLRARLKRDGQSEMATTHRRLYGVGVGDTCNAGGAGSDEKSEGVHGDHTDGLRHCDPRSRDGRTISRSACGRVPSGHAMDKPDVCASMGKDDRNGRRDEASSKHSGIWQTIAHMAATRCSTPFSSHATPIARMSVADAPRVPGKSRSSDRAPGAIESCRPSVSKETVDARTASSVSTSTSTSASFADVASPDTPRFPAATRSPAPCPHCVLGGDARQRVLQQTHTDAAHDRNDGIEQGARPASKRENGRGAACRNIETKRDAPTSTLHHFSAAATAAFWAKARSVKASLSPPVPRLSAAIDPTASFEGHLSRPLRSHSGRATPMWARCVKVVVCLPGEPPDIATLLADPMDITIEDLVACVERVTRTALVGPARAILRSHPPKRRAISAFPRRRAPDPTQPESCSRTPHSMARSRQTDAPFSTHTQRLDSVPRVGNEHRGAVKSNKTDKSPRRSLGRTGSFRDKGGQRLA